MLLASLDNVSLAFAATPIFRAASLHLETGERVCLIGANGAGKSSLLGLLTGTLEPDEGEISIHPDCQVGVLRQALPDELDLTVQEFVRAGLAEHSQLIEDYERQSAAATDDNALRALSNLQARIDAHGGWNVDQRAATVATELGLPVEQRLGQLSGGWRRRVGLARALVGEPDLLLLDEPTNHLDLSTIRWLEDRVRAFSGSVLFITHDRAFIESLATRIVEIDRGKLRSWPGSFSDYRRNKALALEEEKREQALFEKKLNIEETWIRQGIKARRTRNEGRVRALSALREEQSERESMKPNAQVRMTLAGADASGRKVISVKNLNYGYNDETLISDLSLKIVRGDRIGLIGNNGVGKSTLLRLLLGQLEPRSGTIKQGTNLSCAYFDQLRRDLDESQTVAEVVGDGREYITIDGNQRHVIGYLRGFLFSAARAREPVSVLSGGERNRLILAKLFSQPSNLLVLDEPTNDLDMQTLEVLEQKLVEYTGTLLIVSHDRAFLDNVVTSILVFEDGGRITRYEGGYSDWEARGIQLAQQDAIRAAQKAEAVTAAKPAVAPRKAAKLSYKLKRELDELPGAIDRLEQQVAALESTTGADDFYSGGWDTVEPVLAELENRRTELDQAMARWDELATLEQQFRKD